MTNYFRKYVSLYSTTLSSSIGTGTSETITLASVTNVPTTTEITITIDRVDASGTATPIKMERITGTLSGSNLTSYTRGADNTTDQAHSAGAVVEMVWNAADRNSDIDGILVEHNQTGTHKPALVTTLKASGAEVTTGTEDAKIVTPKAIKDAGIVANPIDGWVTAGTFTYASADAPTYTITVASGAAAIYNVGDRIKLTNSTVKYFIVTAVADTTLTVYGGTDYTLSGGAITAPFYSHSKSPLGFPLDPSKWTVSLTDTSDRSQATPTTNSYYNLGSLSISLPIGCWDVFVAVPMGVTTTTSGAVLSTRVALSDVNNSVSDADLAQFSINTSSPQTTGSRQNYVGIFIRKCGLLLAAKTTYYLIATSTENNCASLIFAGTASSTRVRAVCAYL